MTYVTTRDIVIPAGTKVQEAPHRVERATPFVSVLQAASKDSTMEWTMPLDEALELGIIQEQ